jgi:peptidoglycan/LPS O-acetylase OafA/YrhL
MAEKIYRADLDFLKGLAIISVVIYHSGFLSTGYLGVDAFFVINGFLIIPNLLLKPLNWGGVYKMARKKNF